MTNTENTRHYQKSQTVPLLPFFFFYYHSCLQWEYCPSSKVPIFFFFCKRKKNLCKNTDPQLCTDLYQYWWRIKKKRRECERLWWIQSGRSSTHYTQQLFVIAAKGFCFLRQTSQNCERRSHRNDEWIFGKIFGFNIPGRLFTINNIRSPSWDRQEAGVFRSSQPHLLGESVFFFCT